MNLGTFWANTYGNSLRESSITKWIIMTDRRSITILLVNGFDSEEDANSTMYSNIKESVEVGKTKFFMPSIKIS